MLARMVGRSLRNNWVRQFIVTAAFGVAAATLVAGGTFYVDSQSKMRSQLRAYGPNLTILPRSGTLDVRASIAVLDRLPKEELRGLGNFLYGVVEVDQANAVVCGFEPESAALFPWWKLEGRWPSQPGECVVGKRLARWKFIRTGGEVEVTGRAEQPVHLRVTGVLDAGGPEDDYLLATLQKAQEILDLPGRISVIQARVQAGLDEIRNVASAINGALPQVGAEPVYQLARAEEQILGRIRGILLLSLIAVLATCSIGVAATVSASIVEREKEIALMMALGSTRGQILKLFLSEMLVAASVGGAAGAVAGVGLAVYLGMKVFSTTLSMHPEVILATFGVLGLVAVSSVLACSRPMFRIRAAQALKGE